MMEVRMAAATNDWPSDRLGRVFSSRMTAGDSSDLQKLHKDLAVMQERFAKLLLGEDMRGGGKGVSTALALSNGITNLAASVFGEQQRLQPICEERKARWKKEIDWLLSVTDHIVEFVPSQQKMKDGGQMEIMTTRQRNDLLINIPALRKLDAMLIGFLDNYKDHNVFWYVSDMNEGDGKDGQWFLPMAKVPKEGLTEDSRKWLLIQKESVRQVMKAALAINAQVFSEMVVPQAYLDSLPKNGKEILGDIAYRSIAVDSFDPEQFFLSLDLSSGEMILDLKNRIEASILIWKRKLNNKDNKSSWNSTVSLEKRVELEERAQTILVLLKQRFPVLPQSMLEISKIQYNKDVGHSVLESYSRVLKSLAHTVVSLIEDVLHSDLIARNPSLAELTKQLSPIPEPMKLTNTEMQKLKPLENLDSATLSEFVICKKDLEKVEALKDIGKEGVGWVDGKQNKLSHVITAKKKFLQLATMGGTRSPTARH